MIGFDKVILLLLNPEVLNLCILCLYDCISNSYHYVEKSKDVARFSTKSKVKVVNCKLINIIFSYALAVGAAEF